MEPTPTVELPMPPPGSIAGVEVRATPDGSIVFTCEGGRSVSVSYDYGSQIAFHLACEAGAVRELRQVHRIDVATGQLHRVTLAEGEGTGGFVLSIEDHSHRLSPEEGADLALSISFLTGFACYMRGLVNAATRALEVVPRAEA